MLEEELKHVVARGSGYELERRFSKFVEIKQSKNHYAVQGHSK